MLKYDGAFAYDDDAFALLAYQKLCYNMLNLTKLKIYYMGKPIFSKSMPIYDFHIYVRFTLDFGIYSILSHKNHKNQYIKTIDYI